MAGRMKPPKAGKPAKGAKDGDENVVQLKQPKGKKPKKGSNLPDPDAIKAHFQTFQDLHDELGSVSGEVRKRIADAYSTAAADLGVPKKVIKHLWGLEKFRMAQEEREHDFDSRDRDALVALAESLGAETPLGRFALEASGRAKSDGFGGGSGEPMNDVEDDDSGTRPEED